MSGAVVAYRSNDGTKHQIPVHTAVMRVEWASHSHYDVQAKEEIEAKRVEFEEGKDAVIVRFKHLKSVEIIALPEEICLLNHTIQVKVAYPSFCTNV